MDDVRMYAGRCGHHFDEKCRSCANALEVTNGEIDRLHAAICALEAKVAELEGALEPFAKAADAFDDERRIVTEARSVTRPNYYLTARDLHRARTTLAGKGEGV